MLLVDAHAHVSPTWYEPVEALLFQMDTYGVDKAVLVQLNGQFDNSYQMECASKHARRFSSVVTVDATDPAAADKLHDHARRGAAGLRLRATDRSPGSNPLAIWQAAERSGLPVSCSGSGHEFASEEFAAVAASVPDLTIILEHLAATHHPDDSETLQLRRKAFRLARLPRVHVKIHGLGEFARRQPLIAEPFPFEQPIPPVLDMALEAFGPERMMWGSDYPPVSTREGYGNALRLTMAALSGLGDEPRMRIFGGNAAAMYFGTASAPTQIVP